MSVRMVDYVTITRYGTAHSWMHRHHAQAGRCEWCGSRRITEWVTAIPGRWTRNFADWLELCIPCHKSYDGQKRMDRACPKCGASDWIPNPSYHAPGATRCKSCTYAANRRRAELQKLKALTVAAKG